MNTKSLLAHIFLKNGHAVSGPDNFEYFGDGNAYQLAKYYEHGGADGLVVFDFSITEECHEENVQVIRDLCNKVNIPIIIGGHVNSLSNIGRFLEIGCAGVVLSMENDIHRIVMPAASEKFGKDKVSIAVQDFSNLKENAGKWKQYASRAFMIGDPLHMYHAVRSLPLPCVPIIDTMDFDRICTLLNLDSVSGISGDMVSSKSINLHDLKERLENSGIRMNSNTSAIPWSEFKLNSDGMIPVVVQDYKTNEVLMLAYMNEEAFENTIKTGIMTYWSRSRQELWVKGATSGHYQYVKQLSIDCDNDTILAKVSQVGAACHTGNRSCFYRDLMKKQYKEDTPASVLKDVYDSILEQKNMQTRDEFRSRIADAAFILLNNMAHSGLTLEDVADDMVKKYLKQNKDK